MSDHLDRAQFGDVLVVLQTASSDGAQIFFGAGGSDYLYMTQATDEDGVAGEIVNASEVSIGVEGDNSAESLAKALRWLADAIDRHRKE